MAEERNVPKYRELKSPATAQIELTSNCNNLCRYCYNSFRGEKDYDNGLQLKDSLRIGKEIVDNEVFEVVLTGGEPLLRRDLLYPLAEYLSSENVDVKMNTNLTLIDKDDPKKIEDSGILSVFGSLPSFNEKNYNRITRTERYRNAINGIEILLKSGIPTGINMVVTKLNREEVYETGKFLYELGIKSFCATPASPCYFMPKEIELKREEVVKTLDDLLRLKDEFGMRVDVVEPLPRCIVEKNDRYEIFLRRDCAAGKLTASISSKGDVSPCTHVQKSYGNLLKENLSQIWKRMSNWRNGTYVPEHCMPCKELEICSLGCREAAKIRKGSYTEPDPWVSGKVLTKNRQQEKDFELDEDTFLKVSERVKFREEKEGYLVFCSDTHSVVYLNPPFFKLLIGLKRMGEFTINSIKKESSSENEFSNIVKFLKKRGLIIT